MTLRILGTVGALVLATAAAVPAFANEPAGTSVQYDAELAQKLGADEYGMRSYVLAILSTGPNDGSIQGEARQEIFRGHFANMGRLADEGKLAVAGPFGKNDQRFRGIFILAVETVEEARALAQTDPAVKAGIFVVDYFPWYGSAALMQTNETHRRIAASDI